VPDDRGTAEQDLITILILGMPVPVYLRASEHGDELMREFALIAASAAGAGGELEVPTRLTAVVEEMRGRFSGFTLQPEAELADAARRRVDVINLEYRLPRDAIQAVADLGDLLDEADEFCRTGDLLTLATPAEALAFRRWFLGEFARQAAGEAPRSWSDWVGQERNG
jgi:hypothetical protein